MFIFLNSEGLQMNKFKIFTFIALTLFFSYSFAQKSVELEKECKMNKFDACITLGVMHEHGKGFRQNKQKALEKIIDNLSLTMPFV